MKKRMKVLVAPNLASAHEALKSEGLDPREWRCASQMDHVLGLPRDALYVFSRYWLVDDDVIDYIRSRIEKPVVPGPYQVRVPFRHGFGSELYRMTAQGWARYQPSRGFVELFRKWARWFKDTFRG